LNPKFVVIVSADGEWQAIPKIFPDAEYSMSPFGQYFVEEINGEPVVIMYGGWGKIPSAASAQYAIDRWNPKLLVNLGTCGGFRGEIEQYQVALAEKTVPYDIINQIGDPDSAIRRLTTEIDLSWLKEPYPIPVVKGTIVSGDRDLIPEDVPKLREKYGAKVGDWESASIAYVCDKNNVKLLILRGVSDLVGPDGGDAYGQRVVWVEAAERIMRTLFKSLPDWLGLFKE
jgi:adenosylhomocysteine nucleosidase